MSNNFIATFYTGTLKNEEDKTEEKRSESESENGLEKLLGLQLTSCVP